MKAKKRSWAADILVVASFLALLVSAYLLYTHYSSETSSWCNLGESLNCDIVNKGEYSTIDGPLNLVLGTYLNIPVPNALVSILVFLIILALAVALRRGTSWYGLAPAQMLALVRSLLGLSILYALFLVYIEAYVLYTWCIVCLVLDAVIVVAAIAALFMGVKR